MTFLTACSQGHSNEDTKQLILPSIVQYSQNQQSQVKREMDTNCCPQTVEFLIDYGIMRDETREALK